jgi:hypothetical protein
MMTVMGATVPANMNMTFDEFRATYKARLTVVNDILKKYNVRLGLEFLGPQCMHLGTCGGGNRGARAGGRRGLARQRLQRRCCRRSSACTTRRTTATRGSAGAGDPVHLHAARDGQARHGSGLEHRRGL